MYIFYQVRVRPPTLFVFGVTYVRSFLFDYVVDKQFPKEYNTFPILIGGHTQESITWNVDPRHYGLYFVVMLNSNYSYVNNINNIHRQ